MHNCHVYVRIYIRSQMNIIKKFKNPQLMQPRRVLSCHIVTDITSDKPAAAHLCSRFLILVKNTYPRNIVSIATASPMGRRNSIVTTALWVGVALVLPHTTIAASFLAPAWSRSNHNTSAQRSLGSSWQGRRQHFHLSQDENSRRRFSTPSLLWLSGDGAEDAKLDDALSVSDSEPQGNMGWIADEHQKASTQPSQFAFQRSLLAARLAMEAGASKDGTIVDEQRLDPETIASDYDSSPLMEEMVQEKQTSAELMTASMLEKSSEVASSSIEIDSELEAKAVVVTIIPSPFAFQQALLKTRLEMDARTQEAIARREDERFDAVLNEAVPNVPQEAAADNVLEGTDVKILFEGESEVIADIELMQDDTESQFAGPISASDTPAVQASEEISAVAFKEVFFFSGLERF